MRGKISRGHHRRSKRRGGLLLAQEPFKERRYNHPFDEHLKVRSHATPSRFREQTTQSHRRFPTSSTKRSSPQYGQLGGDGRRSSLGGGLPLCRGHLQPSAAQCGIVTTSRLPHCAGRTRQTRPI